MAKSKKKTQPSLESLDFDAIAKKAGEIESQIKKEGKTIREAFAISPEVENDMYVLAKYFYDQGKNQEAGSIFQSLLLFAPNNFDYAYGLASAYHQSGDFINASMGFYRSFLLNPKNPFSTYYLSDCFIQLEDPQDALNFLDTTLAIVDAVKQEEYQPLKERCLLMQDALRKTMPHKTESKNQGAS